MPRRPDPKQARQGGVKFHVTGAPSLPFLGRCGTTLHGDDTLARLVPVEDRCQAPACRAAWPAQLRGVS